MNVERGRRHPEPTATLSRGAMRPRVVIFDSGAGATVEVVELPVETEVGSTIRHHDAGWRVVDERPHSRVLIAAPAKS